MDGVNEKAIELKAPPMKLLPRTPVYDLTPTTSTPAPAPGAEMPPLAPDRQPLVPLEPVLAPVQDSKSSSAESSQPEAAPLQRTSTLNNEALNLLDQYSTQAKADCRNLLQSVSNRSLSEDEILDGKIDIVDSKTSQQDMGINELAKTLGDDISRMQKITASTALPKSQLPNEQDYLTKYWAQTKNNAGAALLNANDILVDTGKLGTTDGSTNKLKEDAVSAYQALNEAQGGIAHLQTSGKKDWAKLWQLQANKDVVSPLSKISEAADDLAGAKVNLEIASHIDPKVFTSGLGRLAMSSMSGGPEGAAVGAAVMLGVTLFRGLKARADNNKVGAEALNEIKACVKSFHRAEDQCQEFIKTGAAQTDAVAAQQVKHCDEELQQVMPKLDELYKMTEGKHASWKQLNRSITELVQDERIIDLYRQSRMTLDQIENANGAGN